MGKKVAIAVVLVAAAVVIFIVLAERSGLIGGAKEPQFILEKPVSRIDKNTLEVITLTTSEWEKLGYNALFWFKNPKTGGYTMLPVMKCANCGAQIPAPPSSLLVGALATKAEKDPSLKPLVAEAQKMLDNYVCPKCGKSPFANRALPGGGAGMSRAQQQIQNMKHPGAQKPGPSK